MFEEIFGYPIEQATNEKVLWVIQTTDDDGYVDHNLLLDAIYEKERRIANGTWIED